MESNDFVVKKLNNYSEKLTDMSEEERVQFMDFMVNVAIKHNDRLIGLSYDANDQIMALATEVELLQKEVEIYKSFISDSRLDSQFRFHSRGKEVI